MTKRDKPKTEPFIRHPVELIRSPSLRVLSRAGHKILMCIESELARRKGKDNGKLPVPYETFIAFGLHHHAIGPALREVEALGLNQITERGYAGNAEHRRPNLMRLTYLPSGANAEIPATNEWKSITAIEAAEKIAKNARNSKAAGYPRKRRRKHFPNAGKRKSPMPETGSENDDFQCRKPAVNDPNPQCRKPAVLSRYASHLLDVEASSGGDAPEPAHGTGRVRGRR
jgi:hypothetical protein